MLTCPGEAALKIRRFLPACSPWRLMLTMHPFFRRRPAPRLFPHGARVCVHGFRTHMEVIHCSGMLSSLGLSPAISPHISRCIAFQ